MESNRRLVIPQLGALLRKEPDHKLVFSALLTRDDGLLRSLLIERGVSEVEASGMIDRVIFDFRYAMENGESYTMAGVGSFRAAEGGSIIFEESTHKLEQQDLIPSERSSEGAAQAEPQGELLAEQPVEVVVVSIPEPLRASEPEVQQDPDLKGLNYGQAGSPVKPRRRSRTKARKGVDWWLVIGVAAIAIAMAALLYGFLRDGADIGSQLSLEQFYQD